MSASGRCRLPWRRFFLPSVFALGVSLIASGSDVALSAEPSQPAGELRTQSVTVGGRRFEISLPAKARVRYLGKMASIVLDPNSRQPTVINMQPAGTNPPKMPATTKTIQLNAGAVLTYAIRKGDAGNGRTKEFLVGLLAIIDRTLLVTCWSRDEAHKLGDWCVPYLRTVQIK